MSRHEILGELNPVTLIILRMTLVEADKNEWFTAEDVAISVRELTTVGAIRAVYKSMIDHELMDELLDANRVKKYRLSQRGINMLLALLTP